MPHGRDVLVQRAVAVSEWVVWSRSAGTDRVGKLTNLSVTVRCSQCLRIDSLLLELASVGFLTPTVQVLRNTQAPILPSLGPVGQVCSGADLFAAL